MIQPTPTITKLLRKLFNFRPEIGDYVIGKSNMNIPFIGIVTDIKSHAACHLDFYEIEGVLKPVTADGSPLPPQAQSKIIAIHHWDNTLDDNIKLI